MLDAYDPHGGPKERNAAAQYPPGAAPDAPLAVFDCGSFADPEAHFPDLRARTHLDILKALGAAGAVIGASELNLTADDAQAVFTAPPVPLASCNLYLECGGAQPVPYLTLCPGWYVVGLTAYKAIPGIAPQTWWQLADPVESAQAALAKLPDGARVIVSALDQPPEVVAQLAALPVDAVIGEAGGQAPRNGATVLPPPVPRVTTVTFAQFTQGQRAPRAWSVELADNWHDDDAVLAVLAAEQAAIRDRLGYAKARKGGWKENNFTMRGEYLPQDKPVYDYVGADACASCHDSAYRAWLNSRHSQALASLVEKSEQETLDCLQCHTVALLKDGGYDPLEPRDAVGAVSCESCHGAGRKHVELMQGGKGAGAAGGLGITRGTLQDCLQCHDDFNSPDFDAAAFWEMIKH